MEAIVGTPYTILLDTYVGQEFLVPDSGSMSYTVYDNAGAVISGLNSVVISGTAQKNQVIIPQAAHTVGSGLAFEQRTVLFTFFSGMKPYNKAYHYHVTPFLNYRVTPQDVLTLVGVQEGEILLDEINLLAAYFEVDAVLSGSLAAELASGTTNQAKANQAIALKAAQVFLRTIELRAWRKFGGDSLSYNRFEKIDFEAIRNRLNGQFDLVISELLGEDVATTFASTYLVLTEPTNPITGE